MRPTPSPLHLSLLFCVAHVSRAAWTCNTTTFCDSREVCTTVCARGTVAASEWYTASWRTQNELALSHTLCSAQLLGTHNSAITLADGYGGEDSKYSSVLQLLDERPSLVRTNNQLFSLTDQLNLGARMLEVDVHWVAKSLRAAHCGGFQSRVLTGLVQAIKMVAHKMDYDVDWDVATIGCSPGLSGIPVPDQKLFSDVLAEVSEWLSANERQVIVLYLDNDRDLQEWKKVPRMVAALDAAFGHIAYLPRDLALEDGGEWPTLGSMVRRNKRLVIVSRTDYDSPSLFVREDVCQWTETKPVAIENGCDAAGKLVRPIENLIRYGPFSNRGKLGNNTNVFDAALMRAWTTCGGVPSLDLLTPDKAAHLVWTWRADVVARPGDWAWMSVLDGRWVTNPDRAPANDTFALACRDITTSKWSASTRCGSGTEWSVPTTGGENAALWEASKANSGTGSPLEYVKLNYAFPGIP
jgi:hypothetical protein